MRGEWTPVTTRTVDLGYEQLLVLESQRGAVVRVLQGNMWLTEEGRSQDVFAGSGSEVPLEAGGRAVIEALGSARVLVIEPRATGRLARISEALRLRELGRRLALLGRTARRALHA